MTSEENQSKRRITLELPHDVITWIDTFRSEWGLPGRGPTVERLLRELFADQQHESGSDQSSGDASVAKVHDPAIVNGNDAGLDLFDEAGALVLVSNSRGGELGFDFETRSPVDAPRPRAAGGIDLPGFVRRQSDQLKRAARPHSAPDSASRDTFPLVEQLSIENAMDVASRHWLELYGSTANEHVLEAAMSWLAKDIWPHVDQSDGRPFTWSLANSISAQLAPSWQCTEPSFERVMVMAGLLEDPFSSSTLSLRIPTMIRRFVHRFRRRRKGMSFETLANTMSLHGALKLLNLPTTPGHRLTLADIREAYRDQALKHHPDSGGSAEQMRRLNEAYQMLKELYRST